MNDLSYEWKCSLSREAYFVYFNKAIASPVCVLERRAFGSLVDNPQQPSREQ